jgi:hypothetical protein
MEIEACAEGSLRFEVISRWPTQFDDSVWKTRPFSTYTGIVDTVKAMVLAACERTAEDYGLYVPDDLARELQSGVTVAATPLVVLVSIVDCVGSATGMGPDSQFVFVLREGLETNWAQQVDAAKYWRQARVRELTLDLPAVQQVVLSAINEVLQTGRLMLSPEESTRLLTQVTLDSRVQDVIEAMKDSATRAIPIPV